MWTAVIVAAGRGTRFGRAKQFVEVAGFPLVGWSLRAFGAMPEVSEIIVATEEAWIQPMRELASSAAPLHETTVVAGGATRQESVRAALRALSDRCNAAFVHDGARPLVRAHDVRAGMSAVRRGHAAVLAAPVVDTIERVDPATMTVRETLSRGELWAAQTPQFAMRTELIRAHTEAHHAGIEATDDIALLERIGVNVHVIASTSENFKVTNPQDVARAELLLRERLEHAPQEAEVLYLEVFADESLVEALERELEGRGARIDGIERDLPGGVAVRAFIPADAMRGFSGRFEAFAQGTATFTTRFSHYAGSDENAGMRV